MASINSDVRVPHIQNAARMTGDFDAVAKIYFACAG